MRAYLVAFTFVAIILLQSWLVVAQTEALQVQFDADPRFENVNEAININNATSDQTVIGEWRADLGDDMPNGTFYGSLLSPAKFKNNAIGSWYPDDDYFDTGRFTYVTISAHFNLTSQQIMAGASEWWMRTPFDPVSVEASGGLYVAIFNGYTNTSTVTLDDGYNNQGSGRTYENIGARPTIGGIVPHSYIPLITRGWEYWSEVGGTSFSDWPNQDMIRNVNGRLYIRMDAIIEPAVDYIITFAFRMVPDVPLYTYWSTSEQPTGNTSAVAFYEVEIAGVNDDDDEGNVTLLDRVEMLLGLDLDYSFIFVEGVGYGGLFGKQIEVRRGSTLVTYPFLNTSRDHDDYPSFCLPFISNATVGIHPQIHQGSGASPGDSKHKWYFNAAGGEGPWYTYYFNPTTYKEETLTARADKGNSSVEVADTTWAYVGLIVYVDDDNSPAHSTYVTSIDGDDIYLADPLPYKYSLSENAIVYCWLDTYYDYQDFMLYSSNRTVDYATFNDDDRWNVATYWTFNDTANITLLCYKSDRPDVDWDELDPDQWNSSLSPWGRPSFGDNWYQEDSRGYVAWMSYEVWVSARTTDGQWAQVDESSDGKITYNYHFPQRIELSAAKWYVQNGTTETEWTSEGYWEQAMEHWSEGHYLRALWYGFRAIVQTLWDGGTMVAGRIYDGLRDAWDTIKEWAEVVYSKIVEFVGWIWDVIQQAIDTIAGWWNAFKYMVAPMVMILFIGLTSKVAAWLFMGEKKGVKA